MALARGILIWLPAAILEQFQNSPLFSRELLLGRARTVNGWSKERVASLQRSSDEKLQHRYFLLCLYQGELLQSYFRHLGGQAILARATYLRDDKTVSAVPYTFSARTLEKILRDRRAGSAWARFIGHPSTTARKKIVIMAEDPILDPTVLLRWPEFRKELRDIFRQASYADLEYSLRIAALAGYCETWDLEKVLEDSRSHEASIEYAIYYLRASFSPSGLAAVHRHFSRSVTVDILIAIGVLPAGIDRFSALNAALGRLQPDLLEGALLRHATPTEEKVLWPGGTGAKPLLTPDLPKRVRTIRSRLPEIVRLGYSIPAEYDLFLNILLGEQVDTGSLTLEMLELMIVVAHPQCPEQFSASEVRGTTWRNCGLYYDLPRFFRALRDWEPALSDYFIELAARGQIEQIEDCPVWVSLPVR